jgi:hypothetical protein
MPTSGTISTGANINNASRLVLVGLGLLLTLLVPLQVRRFEDSKIRRNEGTNSSMYKIQGAVQLVLLLES